MPSDGNASWRLVAWRQHIGCIRMNRTKFPEIPLNSSSEYLMLLSVVLIGLLFLWLVSLMELDQSIIELPMKGGVFDDLV